MLIEKNGEYMDNLVPSLKIHSGRIACLQNLIVEPEHRNLSDVYCHHANLVSVVPLDLHYLREILEESDEKMLKFWQIIAYRLIILHHETIYQFR